VFGKKVVVKFKDGHVLKGWTVNISPNKEVFYLHKHKEFREEDKKDIIEVKLSSLRAVFFVKDHKLSLDFKTAAGSYQSPRRDKE